MFNTHWDNILLLDFHIVSDVNFSIIANSMCLWKHSVVAQLLILDLSQSNMIFWD